MVVLRSDGTTPLALGDLARPVFPRSSNKPLQAVGLLREGWVPGGSRELALATASHSGEPVHLDVVRGMLRDVGEQALGCPPMLPLSDDAAYALLASGGTATSLTMNCSGKHAAMLQACRQRGWPTDGYLDDAHPLQVALTAAVGELAGEQVLHVAVDGCGAPQHALTLPGLARAFLRLVKADEGTPERRVADAMRTHPHLVGGTGRDVTALMETVPGLLAKDGAEGVYAVALPGVGAVALKVEDGAARARLPVLAAALQVLGVDVGALGEVPVLGGGRVVGVVRATAVMSAP
ncbi:MAG: L-asparaginase [Frankiales bacterium]|nr:L-asparaginase [Frankiales bacterium]